MSRTGAAYQMYLLHSDTCTRKSQNALALASKQQGFVTMPASTYTSTAKVKISRTENRARKNRDENENRAG